MGNKTVLCWAGTENLAKTTESRVNPDIAGHRVFALVALGETVMQMQNEEQRKLFTSEFVPPRRNPVAALLQTVLNAVVRVLTGGTCTVTRMPGGPIHANGVKK